MEKDQELPIIFTESGKVLKIAYDILSQETIPNELNELGQKLYNIIIAAQLSLFNFDPSGDGYMANPIGSFNPLKEMLKILDEEGPITRERFIEEVGTRNHTYWRNWLVTTGLINYDENNYTFSLTDNFEALKDTLKNRRLNQSYDENHWKEIRRNPFSEDHPYGDEIKKIFASLTSEILSFEEEFAEPIVENIKAVNSRLTTEIKLGDVKTIEDFTKEQEKKERREIQRARAETSQQRRRRIERKNREARAGKSSKPKKVYVEQFPTDPSISADVKEEAGHLCQACRQPTFETTGGYNYTEGHHLISVRRSGDDAPYNIAVLCPLCHRKIHYGTDEVKLEVYRNLRGNGVVLDLAGLLEKEMISQPVHDSLNAE